MAKKTPEQTRRLELKAAFYAGRRSTAEQAWEKSTLRQQCDAPKKHTPTIRETR